MQLETTQLETSNSKPNAATRNHQLETTQLETVVKQLETERKKLIFFQKVSFYEFFLQNMDKNAKINS